jgi:apurinic endonuclease APN1
MSKTKKSKAKSKILRIGSQSPSDTDTGSLLDSIKAVVKNGGNVVQIFLRDMCTTSVKGRKDVPEVEQKKIKEYKKKVDLLIFVHASYLINFCKIPVGLTRIQWAYKILAEDMTLAENMALNGVVIHMCAKKAVDEKWQPFMMTDAETEKKMVRHLIYFFKEYGRKFPHVKLLLENSASVKTKIGGTMKSLGAVVQPLRRKYGTRIGTCIDTCHAFASGYPINTVAGMKLLFSDFKKYVGPLSYLTLIHLNDSATPLGSNKDRHAGIGDGFIFSGKEGHEALLYIIEFADKNNIPMCLETHSNYKKEIGMIKKAFKTHRGGQPVKSVPVSKIIHILEEFQKYHKSLGNHREAAQYAKATASLKASGIKTVTSGKELMGLPWIGKGIAAKVDEFLKTGKIGLLSEFNKDPKVKAYRELNDVFDVGPKRAKALISQGVLSVKDFKRKAKTGNIKVTRAQSIGLKHYDDLQKKIPRKESGKIRRLVEKEVRSLFGPKTCTLLAGSYRTGKKESGDVDLVVGLQDLKTDKEVRKHPILEKLVTRLFKKKLLIDTLLGSEIPKPTQTSYIGVGKVGKTARHIDIHAVGWDELPFHMLYFGSGEKFSRAIRQWAKDKGYKLSNFGLYKNGKRVKGIKTEKDIFKVLDLKWVPPEKRRTAEI